MSFKRNVKRSVVSTGRLVSRPDPATRRVILSYQSVGERKVWQIVGEPEADVGKGKISVTSPITRALIGKNKGDTVEVEAPGGVKSCKVRKVGWSGPQA